MKYILKTLIWSIVLFVTISSIMAVVLVPIIVSKNNIHNEQFWIPLILSIVIFLVSVTITSSAIYKEFLDDVHGVTKFTWMIR